MAQQLVESSPPRVREIPARESLAPFIELQWTLNRGDPNWRAPLRMSLDAALDRNKHPFHAHAEVAYFVAERDGEAVGRIAAIVNRLHNEFHDDRVGFCGLFECENDPSTAAALFDSAADWLRDRGMLSMRGPLHFSTNEEIASPGVLVDGFDSPPYFMMTHNPRYYGDLFEESDFAPAKDLLAFLLDEPDAPPERGRSVMNRILDRKGVSLRSLDLKRFRQEVDAIKEVYNSAWSRNWGFVPMTDAEFEHLAKDFRPVVDPELCVIAEIGDEPVGFYLALPNLNDAIAHIPSGRLLPFGWIKLLWYKRKVKTLRVITLGFRPHLHRAGLGYAFYHRAWETSVRAGYVSGEASWILEDNHEMVRALEHMGGKPYKRYRIYEREL